MSRGDIQSSGVVESKLERLYVLRDRLAYAIYLRKDLGKRAFFGFSVGIALIVIASGLYLNRASGPDPGWRIHLPPIPVTGTIAGLACGVLGLMYPFWGGILYFVSLIGLLLVYTPELFGPGIALISLTLFMWLMVRPQRGAMAALLVIPFLEAFVGLGALAPLGFACFYPMTRAILMTATSFIWVVAIGLVYGPIPRYGIEAGGLLGEFHWLTRTEVADVPWSAPVIESNYAVFTILQDQLVGKGALIWPLFIQIALAALVAWVVRSQYTPIGFQDRLALEYLSREGEKVRPTSIQFFGAPLVLLGGAAVWMSLQVALSYFFPGIYDQTMAQMDLLAACFLVPVVLLNYHGDPIMPQEFSRTGLGGVRKSEHSAVPQSAFRIPTPSEMRLNYPAAPPTPGKPVDPSQVRLRNWKDKVDLDWEGVGPGGKKIEYHKDSQISIPSPETPKRQPSITEQFVVGGVIDNQYRVERIHQGGMGTVYVVTDTFSDVRYAVKTLRDDLRGNDEAVSRFSTEAKTWIRLGYHPTIVQAMYYRDVQGRPLLFLEYVDGTDLEEVFSRPGPGPDLLTLLDWGIQICEGMHYTSTKVFPGGIVGLVHRDIKPGNLMLTRDGKIKITDFGLAKAAEAPTSMTREKVGMGTLKYMAPEQVKDAKHVDLRADIYAVGAVLYEGAVGHPPFTDEDSINLYMSVLSKDPARMRQLRPDVPEEFERIIMRCLLKDRDLRYSSFEELGWALTRLKQRLGEGGNASRLRVVE